MFPCQLGAELKARKMPPAMKGELLKNPEVHFVSRQCVCIICIYWSESRLITKNIACQIVTTSVPLLVKCGEN